MEYVHLKRENGISTITLQKGKVNPINEQMVDELTETFGTLADSKITRAAIFTGSGKFFSFGFEIPELYHYSEDDFRRFLIKFTDLYKLIFTHPKPIVAAINGHAIAGGCMLATACDYRLMVTGKAKISLNEVTFGASVFAGSTEILKHVTGDRNAAKILLSGSMYTAAQAARLGLVDEVCDGDDLITRAMAMAQELAGKDGVAYASLKKLLRQDILARIEKFETDSISEFIDIWYSETTRAQTKKIVIN